jgi:hypothetical protein
MKAIMRRTAIAAWMVLALFILADSAIAADSGQAIELNKIAFTFAVELIKQGDAIADGKGEWAEHRPSAGEENEFIRVHGFAEYAKWHLGIDRRFSENSKRRYKFPYGDFKSVHRCGLLAAKSRARQYGYTDIKDAATELVRSVKTKPKD